MPIKSIQLSQQGLEQVSRLKRRTGIKKNNVLCRWALCISLREPGVPVADKLENDPNGRGEIAWETLVGANGSLYLCLMKQRCFEDGIEITPENLKTQFVLHIHRGLGYLLGSGKIQSIEDLVQLGLQENNPDAAAA